VPIRYQHRPGYFVTLTYGDAGEKRRRFSLVLHMQFCSLGSVKETIFTLTGEGEK
jgi:hypothetical protein